MSTARSPLITRQTDLTQRLILDAALELLAETPGEPLSVRAAARRAGVSERTVFRYFAAREDLLDAAAGEFSRRLNLPATPTSLEELRAFPAALYAAFEAQEELVRAALASELSERVRSRSGVDRRQALSALIDRLAPGRPADERRIAAANVHYHLVGTTWHYYRFHLGFQPGEAVRAAETILDQALRGLGLAVA